MSDVLSVLGIDLDELEWQDLALCQGTPTNNHYDDYEADPNVARVVDARCLACPVMAQCLQMAVDNNEWGTWGGIYLVSGKPDMGKNAHKSPDIWEQIRGRIGESVL